MPKRKTANAKAPAETGVQLKSSLSTYFSILGAAQEQIRFADRKAAFYFGMNALMFAFIGRNLFDLRDALTTNKVNVAGWISGGLFVIYGLLAAASVAIVVWSVLSRFGELAPTSKVYFGHIIKHYGKDYGKYVADHKTNDRRRMGR